MTTLFSVFAPFILLFKLKMSLILLLLISLGGVTILILGLLKTVWGLNVLNLNKVFSNAPTFSVLLLSIFASLSFLNLLSMAVYSYPVTTTLGFNISAAISCWICSVLLQSTKIQFVSAFLPSNSPWYLISFLSLVEVVSVSVRPITLCFRLLANMTAGHVLLALICKMSYFWGIGAVFGVLELAVALIQAFVFSMLISVYLEEAMTH